MQKTKGDTFDLRAEEDAARRLNVGKAITSNSSITGLNSRAKKTDLIGKTALKEKVDAIAKNHNVTFDPEVSLYLLSTIEERIKTLLQRAIKAQQHRTSSSHLRQPPLTKDGRAIWDQRIMSDPNSVMDAVNKMYREEEQEFRKLRMTRLAKEAELQRIKERANSLQPDGIIPNTFDEMSVSGSGGGDGGGGGPSTPMGKSSPSSFSTPAVQSAAGASGSAGGGSSTPMFGAIRESSIKKKPGKNSKMNPRDVSAEVQHKMANATAMRSVGMGKKYGWMTGNAPTISSPLAGTSKKRKAEKEKEKEKEKASKLKESVTASHQASPSTPNANGSGNTPKEKDNNNDTSAASTPGGGGGAQHSDADGDRERERERERPSKKARPTIPMPTRRLILVEKAVSQSSLNININTGAGVGGSASGNGTEGGEERRVEDDKVLTLVDLTFALEHGGLGGNGIGNEDEVLKNIWARKGGPWGEDGWEGRK
ncbi:uncharacterized protein I303_102545 [Kwoniella dejecticola CBS 10117]